MPITYKSALRHNPEGHISVRLGTAAHIIYFSECSTRNIPATSLPRLNFWRFLLGRQCVTYQWTTAQGVSAPQHKELRHITGQILFRKGPPFLVIGKFKTTELSLQSKLDRTVSNCNTSGHRGRG
jgi:hypothetical protein